ALSKFECRQAVRLFRFLGIPMTARRWLLLTFSIPGLAVAVTAALAWAVDPYGVLRDPTGRRLSVFLFERKARFLMSRRYVPANFDGLLIGPSSSANWDVPNLAGVRIYNLS